MTKQPEWAEVLRKVEGIKVTDPDCGALTVGDVFRLWENIDVGGFLRLIVPPLESVMLGGTLASYDDMDRRLLAIPARINELALALGDTYWQTLAKAPPKIAVSKSGHHRIRDVRHQVILIDVAAWRAWSAEHRDPSTLTNDQLKAFVERIERLEEEKKTISDDIKDVYAEAKGNGFDTKILRKVIAIRKMDPNEYAEMQDILELYLQAIGMGYGRAE